MRCSTWRTSELDLIAPGADLIDTRAYERLMQDVQSGVYLGTAVVAGQRCHHLAYRGSEVDWQLWVREGAQPAPCRYVITSKTIAGAPQFAVQVLKWDTSPDVSDGPIPLRRAQGREGDRVSATVMRGI